MPTLFTPAFVRWLNAKAWEGKAASGGRWITIGGSKGEGGKRHGGSPVYIENGRITKGHPSLTGKKIDALKEEGEHGTHRQQLNREKGHSRATWGKKARKEGLDPKRLHQLAADVKAHDAEFVKDRTELLQQARKALKAISGDAQALHLKLRQGADAGSIRGMDEVAEDLQKRHPHLFPENQHASDSLLDLLRHGNPEPMSESDVYDQAMEQLKVEEGSPEIAHHPDDPFPEVYEHASGPSAWDY